MSSTPVQLAITEVKADGRVPLLGAIRDMWLYRELFIAFLERDLRVRYKQTALGVAWVVLQPLVSGLLFASVMGLIRGRFGGAEDLIFFMAGLVPWTSFQNGVQMAAVSLESNANMISKVYFPRLAIPTAHVAGSLVDFAVSFVTLMILAITIGVFSPSLLILLPPLLLIQVATALGLGYILAALNAQYRDVKYAVPFLLQMGMFVTVWIPLSDWRLGDLPGGVGGGAFGVIMAEVLSWNPMACVVENFRAALDGKPPDTSLLFRGGFVALLLLLGGSHFFVARERRLVDIL